jgi:hypothetical protein
MIFSENRYPLFRIMLCRRKRYSVVLQPGTALFGRSAGEIVGRKTARKPAGKTTMKSCAWHLPDRAGIDSGS